MQEQGRPDYLTRSWWSGIQVWDMTNGYIRDMTNGYIRDIEVN
jgi:hypothetical protein